MNDAFDVKNLKSLQRQALRQRRKNLSSAYRKAGSQKICRRLKSLIRRNHQVAVYRAVGSEVDLSHWIETAQKRGMQVFEPYIHQNQRRLWFIPYGETAHRHTIKKRIEDMSIALIPLIGIDLQGFRMGQGGGFYDTSLSYAKFRKPKTVGIGFACQMVENIETETHDLPLDAFVCEDKVYVFAKPK